MTDEPQARDASLANDGLEPESSRPSSASAAPPAPRLRPLRPLSPSFVDRHISQRFQTDIERHRRARLILTVSFATALASLCLAVMWWAARGSGDPTAWVLAALAALAALGMIGVRAGTRLDLAGLCAPMAGLLATATTSLLEGGLLVEGAPWVPLIPLVGVLFLGRRAALSVGIMALMVVLAMCWRSVELGHFATPLHGHMLFRVVALVLAVAFATALGLVYEGGRVAAMVEVARSDAGTRTLLRALPDVLLVLDADHAVAEISQPKGFVFPPEMALARGTNLLERLPPAVAERLRGVLSDAAATHRVQHFEFVVGAEATRRDFEVRVSVSSGVTLVILRDRTSQRAGERVRDDFVSVVSHELRTPLTAIRGALGLMKGLGMTDAAPSSADMMDIAERNSERLSEIIDDLLDVQKIAAGAMSIRVERFAVGPFLEQAVAVNEGYARRHRVALELLPAPAGLCVVSDPARLGQVMANLISNACKFSAAGASVRVAARGVDDHVELSVSDTGRGIPEAFRSQLFQPFAQEQTGNTRETGGTGLGLHIAQQLCERLGGTIDFESEVGVGTTFRVRLPVRDDHA